MKTRFRKILSIAVALVMLISLCLSAPLTVSAATVSVTVNNSGNIYTVDANVGEELAAPAERTNGMHFLGWYSDPACTVEYGVVQENETRKAYAKYPSTYIPFNEKEYTATVNIRDNSHKSSNSSYYKSGVVADPDDQNNKVFKLHSNNLYATVLMPSYDDAGAPNYQLVEGHNYNITFKYKIPDSLTVSSFGLRITQGDSCADSGANRKALDGETGKTITVSNLTVGEWATYTASFTPSQTSTHTSPMLSFNCAGTASGTFGANNYIYFDDVMITDNDFVYDIPAESTETGFEIGEYNKNASGAKAGDFASGTGLFSLSSAEAHSGSTSLMYNTSMQNTLRFVYAYTSTKNALKLESNKTYTITFWYKATAKSDWINIHLGLWDSIKSDNAYSDSSRVDIIKHGVDTTNEWTKVSFNYTTDDCSAKPYIIIGVSGGGSAAKTVYIDDVSVAEYVPAEVSDTFTSFEGCTVKYDGGFSSTTAATISNEQAKSGISSLKIAPGGANTYRSYAYNSQNSVLKLDSYTRYTISYWYMATALGGTYTNIYTTLNGNGNVWDKNIQLNKTGIHSSALNEWHKAEFEVITGDCSSQAY
ncbi:MAG: hypothetical protein J6Q76_03445, partial [Clostridia bacterium]|nr:hypothetical protein [Clostridia bacterium]